MDNFNPYFESCKISNRNMTHLAMKERDDNHNNFINCLIPTTRKVDEYYCQDIKKIDDSFEKNKYKDINMLKGVYISNKNCYWKRYYSDKGEWENQFQEKSYNDSIFNIQTKRKHLTK